MRADDASIDGPSIRPRPAAFDLGETPRHWIPGQPFATHLSNALHLLLPAGERWFVSVFREALPLIRDPSLHRATRGFMGQEAIHARAHAGAIDHLRRHGFAVDAFLARLDAMFARFLAVETAAPAERRRSLLERLAIVAAIEHVTAILGDWILGATGYERAGADPVMLGLFRWHGAEEVEHRAVAFDVHRHLGGGHLQRARVFAWVVPFLVRMWSDGIGVLVDQDPAARGTPRGPGAFHRAAAAGLAPPIPQLLRTVFSYLRPGFHPSRLGSTAAALAYLSSFQGPHRFGPPPEHGA